MFLQHFSGSLRCFVTYRWKSWTNPRTVLSTQLKRKVHFCLYQIFAPSCKLCIPLGHVAVYLTYLLSLEFPGMMAGAVCRVSSSGLVKSGWYRYHFWRTSWLVTCLCANIFHDTAGKRLEGMVEAEPPKEHNSMQTSGVWAEMLSVERWARARRVSAGSKRGGKVKI